MSIPLQNPKAESFVERHWRYRYVDFST